MTGLLPAGSPLRIFIPEDFGTGYTSGLFVDCPTNVLLSDHTLTYPILTP